MLGMTRITKPKLGDIFVRTNHDLAHEEAQVVGMTTWPGGQWKAIVLTESGWDHVTDALEFRSAGEWRPSDWTLEASINAYHPPGVRWDDEEGKWALKDEAKAAKLDAPAMKPASGPRPPAPA